MAWKNTEQDTLADTLLIEHDSIKELDSIHALVDWQAIEQILQEINTQLQADNLIIQQGEVTTGSLHDSNVFEELLTGREKEVYADSAYKSNKHDTLLASKKIKN